jgi:hypothetical protein
MDFMFSAILNYQWKKVEQVAFETGTLGGI